MERSPIVHVVVLYVHPLLGEGLASLLAAEPGVNAVALARDDPTITPDAVWRRADLVVVEESDATRSDSTDGGGSETAVFVIVHAPGGGWIRHRLSDPDAVIDIVRALRRRPVRGETALASAAPARR